MATVRSAKRKYTRNPDPTDPTPQEIIERCAEVQAGWSKAERLRREKWWRSRWAVEVPEVPIVEMRAAGQAINTG